MSNPVDKTDASNRVEDAMRAIQWFAELIEAAEHGNASGIKLATNMLRRLGWAVRRTSKQEQGSDT